MADAIDGTLIHLDNEQYLRGRNFADSADVNLIKVNASDQLEMGIIQANISVINDTYLTGRNNADSALINIIKVNTSDKLAIGADLANLALNNDVYLQGRNNADSAYISMIRINTSDEIQLAVNVDMLGDLTLISNKININKTFTLADNQSAAANITDATVTLSTGKTFKLIYGVYVDATTDLVESGECEFSYDGTNWNQAREYSHDDSLVVFSMSSGQLQYTTPAYTGYADATLTYQIIEL